MNNIAQYLDFANHKQEAAPEDIKSLCQKVKEYGLHAAFVNPCYVSLAREYMGEGVVGTAISFPLGQDTSENKVSASIEAAGNGADELDICMNVGIFKSGGHEEVEGEMKEIVSQVKKEHERTIVKFIIETGFLTDDEIKKASELVVASGADFIKTTSGLGPRGASLRDVALIKEVVGDKVKIKVAGGINTYKEAVSFIQAGAHRIGTSHAVEIIKGD